MFALYYSKGEAVRFVQRMGTGWNLGNSLDVYRVNREDLPLEEYEAYWKNPPVTQEMIAAVGKAGFGTVRIPVSWGGHMDEQGNVDPAFMARVQEVVDYALDNGMYAILNSHHEEWLSTQNNQEVTQDKLENLWRQIAQQFKGYDEHLLFEGINEPRARDSA